jgi:hypothetical protein
MAKEIKYSGYEAIMILAEAEGIKDFKRAFVKCSNSTDMEIVFELYDDKKEEENVETEM